MPYFTEYLTRWALTSFGLDKLLVSVVQSMYENTVTVVKVNGRDSKAFGVGVMWSLQEIVSAINTVSGFLKGAVMCLVN